MGAVDYAIGVLLLAAYSWCLYKLGRLRAAAETEATFRRLLDDHFGPIRVDPEIAAEAEKHGYPPGSEPGPDDYFCTSCGKRITYVGECQTCVMSDPWIL